MTTALRPTGIDQLVINWHVNEACNYRCNYCYAKWTDQNGSRDLIRDPEATEALLRELWTFFSPQNKRNPLRSQLDWKRVRLNFAGGEPLLAADAVAYAARVAEELGFDISIITNGSRLDQERFLDLAQRFEWFGLSIDSPDPKTNQLLGRIDRRGELLDLAELAGWFDLARQNAPSMKLKINTVVSEGNYGTDMTEVLDLFRPDKWKVLRALPTVTEVGTVSDGQFFGFVNRHERFQHIMRVEDNTDMLQTYIMIDPKGRFFQNDQEAMRSGYSYSDPILSAGAGSAFQSVEFASLGFTRRYIQV